MSEESPLQAAETADDPAGEGRLHDDTASADASQSRESPVERLATLFARGDHGYASLPTAISASLRRLDSNRPARRIDAVVGALVAVELPVERMDDDEITRWAAVVHAIALLSGTTGVRVHRRSRSAGQVIAKAGYSSARFARLLTAQGSALPPQVARLTRFLASARAVPLDLRPVAELLLWEGRDAERADGARLTLARGYYTSPPPTDTPD